MKFKLIALAELTAFAKERPEYTLGEIIYSVVRTKQSGCETIKDIRELSDEELYSIIEEVRENEKPE
jgi:hypothetical protein